MRLSALLRLVTRNPARSAVYRRQAAAAFLRRPIDSMRVPIKGNLPGPIETPTRWYDEGSRLSGTLDVR